MSSNIRYDYHKEFKHLSDYIRDIELGKPLEEMGFKHYKNDYTMWNKVEHGLFYSAMIYDWGGMMMFYKITPIEDYVWIPYRNERGYLVEYRLNMCKSPSWTSSVGFLRRMPLVFYIEGKKILDDVRDNHAIPYFEKIDSIEKLNENTSVEEGSSIRKRDELIVAYLAGDMKKFDVGLQSYIRDQKPWGLSCYPEVLTPAEFEKMELAHECDHWRKYHHNILIKTAKEDNPDIYGEYLKKCREFNFEWIRKKAPDLLN